MKLVRNMHGIAILFLALLIVESGSGMISYPTKSEASSSLIRNWNPGHYLLSKGHTQLSDYDDLLKTTSADGTPIFRGIQQRYYWIDLEPTEGNYDFSQITNDLDHIRNLKDANGNPLNLKLIIEIQTKGFQPGEREVPTYLTGSDYGGGVYMDPQGGYAPLRWNDHVRDRLKALYEALGASFNGNSALESVDLDETAIGTLSDINSQGGSPQVTNQNYADAVTDEIAALKKAFPNTVTIQYTNGPRESLSSLDGQIAAGTGIIDAERNYGVGLGGPDVASWTTLKSNLVGRDGFPGAYAFYANAWGFPSVDGSELKGVVPLGAAVQFADYYADVNGKTTADVKDIFDYGRNKLELNYMYWLYRYDRVNDVVNYLKSVVSASDPAGGLVTDLPSGFTVDNIPPTATFAYSTTVPTNQDVTATITPSEPVTLTNNNGSFSHTFTENGSFTFAFVDAAGNPGTATATVANIDKVAPTLQLSVDKPVLSPPNHKLIPIQVSLVPDGTGSGVASVQLTSITSNESANGTGDGNTASDIEGAVYGSSDTSFSLRSERSGNGDGRLYTIMYTVTDEAGNTATASMEVAVPK